MGKDKISKYFPVDRCLTNFLTIHLTILHNSTNSKFRGFEQMKIANGNLA